MFDGSELVDLYAELGEPVTHTPAAGGASTPLQAIFAAPGHTVLGGAAIVDDPTLRFAVAALPSGVARGDALLIRGITYHAREKSQPLLDGLEMTVPLTRS